MSLVLKKIAATATVTFCASVITIVPMMPPYGHHLITENTNAIVTICVAIMTASVIWLCTLAQKAK